MALIENNRSPPCSEASPDSIKRKWQSWRKDTITIDGTICHRYQREISASWTIFFSYTLVWILIFFIAKVPHQWKQVLCCPDNLKNLSRHLHFIPLGSVTTATGGGESGGGVFAGMPDWHLGRHCSDTFGIARHTWPEERGRPGMPSIPGIHRPRTNQLQQPVIHSPLGDKPVK